MSHQPFDSWLVSDEQLEPEQQQTLAAHLQTCEMCRQRATALKAVSELFSNEYTPSPTPGFTHRWHARLSIYRGQRQQQHMWFLTAGLFALSGLIFLGLFLYHQAGFNWIYSLTQSIAKFSLFAARITQLWIVIQSLFSAFPILVPVIFIFGIGTLSAMIALFITWFSSIIKLFRPVQEGVSVR